MWSPKDELVKLLNSLLDYLGVDHLLGTVFFGFLISLFTINDVKNWKNVSKFQKNMDIAIWYGLGMGLAVLVIKYIRGY